MVGSTMRLVIELLVLASGVQGEAFGMREGTALSLHDDSLCRTDPPLGWAPDFRHVAPPEQQQCADQGGEEILQPMWGTTAEGSRHGYAVDAYAIRQHKEVEVLMVSAQDQWKARFDLDPSCGGLGGAKAGAMYYCKFADGTRAAASLSDDQSQFWARTQAVRCRVPDSQWNGGRGISFSGPLLKPHSH